MSSITTNPPPVAVHNTPSATTTDATSPSSAVPPTAPDAPTSTSKDTRVYHPASAASIARIRAFFEQVDTDHSQAISATELQAMFGNIAATAASNGLSGAVGPLPTTLDDAETLIKQLDLNPDGELDEEEFVVWVRKGIAETKEQRMAKADQDEFSEKVNNLLFLVSTELRKGALKDLIEHFGTSPGQIVEEATMKQLVSHGLPKLQPAMVAKTAASVTQIANAEFETKRNIDPKEETSVSEDALVKWALVYSDFDAKERAKFSALKASNAGIMAFLEGVERETGLHAPTDDVQLDTIECTFTDGPIGLMFDEHVEQGKVVLHVLAKKKGSQAAKFKQLKSGDVIVAVGGTPCMGQSKQNVAKLLGSIPRPVTIEFRRGHPDSRPVVLEKRRVIRKGEKQVKGVDELNASAAAVELDGSGRVRKDGTEDYYENKIKNKEVPEVTNIDATRPETGDNPVTADESAAAAKRNIEATEAAARKKKDDDDAKEATAAAKKQQGADATEATARKKKEDDDATEAAARKKKEDDDAKEAAARKKKKAMADAENRKAAEKAAKQRVKEEQEKAARLEQEKKANLLRIERERMAREMFGEEEDVSQKNIAAEKRRKKQELDRQEKARREEEETKERQRLRAEQDRLRAEVRARKVKPTRRKLRELFNKIDANGNGTLERAEVMESVMLGGELGAYITPKVFMREFKRVMKEHTGSNRGHVNFEAFASIFDVNIPSEELVEAVPTTLLLNEDEANKTYDRLYKEDQRRADRIKRLQYEDERLAKEMSVQHQPMRQRSRERVTNRLYEESERRKKKLEKQREQAVHGTFKPTIHSYGNSAATKSTVPIHERLNAQEEKRKERLAQQRAQQKAKEDAEVEQILRTKPEISKRSQRLAGKRRKQAAQQAAQQRPASSSTLPRHSVAPVNDAELFDIFQSLDTNDNGTLETHEVKGVVMLRSDLGMYIKPRRFLEHFDALLRNKKATNTGSGVTFAEFVQLVSQSSTNADTVSTRRATPGNGAPAASPRRSTDREIARTSNKLAVQRYSDEMVHQLLSASLDGSAFENGFALDEDQLTSAVLRSPTQRPKAVAQGQGTGTKPLAPHLRAAREREERHRQTLERRAQAQPPLAAPAQANKRPVATQQSVPKASVRSELKNIRSPLLDFFEDEGGLEPTGHHESPAAKSLFDDIESEYAFANGTEDIHDVISNDLRDFLSDPFAPVAEVEQSVSPGLGSPSNQRGASVSPKARDGTEPVDDPFGLPNGLIDLVWTDNSSFATQQALSVVPDTVNSERTLRKMLQGMPLTLRRQLRKLHSLKPIVGPGLSTQPEWLTSLMKLTENAQLTVVSMVIQLITSSTVLSARAPFIDMVNAMKAKLMGKDARKLRKAMQEDKGLKFTKPIVFREFQKWMTKHALYPLEKPTLVRDLFEEVASRSERTAHEFKFETAKRAGVTVTLGDLMKYLSQFQETSTELPVARKSVQRLFDQAFEERPDSSNDLQMIPSAWEIEQRNHIIAELPVSTRKSLRAIHEEFGLAELRGEDMERMGRLTETVQRQVLQRCIKLMRDSGTTKKRARDVLKFAIGRAEAAAKEKSKQGVLWAPSGVTAMEKVTVAPLPQMQKSTFAAKKSQVSGARRLDRLAQPKARALENPSTFGIVPRGLADKPQDDGVAARQRARQARRARRMRQTERLRQEQALSDEDCEDEYDLDLVESTASMADRRARRARRGEPTRVGGRKGQTLFKDRLPTPPENRSPVPKKGGRLKGHTKPGVPTNKPTKGHLKESMGAHHSSVVPGWYYSPRHDQHVSAIFIDPNTATGKDELDPIWTEPTGPPAPMLAPGDSMLVQEQQKLGMQGYYSGPPGQMAAAPAFQPLYQSSPARPPRQKLTVFARAEEPQSGHSIGASQLTAPQLNERQNDLASPKRQNVRRKKRRGIDARQRQRDFERRKQARARRRQTRDARRAQAAPVAPTAAAMVHGGGEVPVLPPPNYPPPADLMPPAMASLQTGNAIGPPPMGNMGMLLGAPPVASIAPHMALYPGFPPPVPVAPLLQKHAPGALFGPGPPAGALTLENALQTPATKAPPAGGHFRPPAQPPDFSGVILFTNGEPVAMYDSS